MDCTDANTTGSEGRPDAVPILDFLEADEFLADRAGFVHQDATGDRDTRPPKTVPMSSQRLSAPSSPSRARLYRRTIFY